jgi:hypothetical protein
MLHAACLCRHPAAARFFLTGLTRNLRQSVLKSIKHSGEKLPE